MPPNIFAYYLMGTGDQARFGFIRLITFLGAVRLSEQATRIVVEWLYRTTLLRGVEKTAVRRCQEM